MTQKSLFDDMEADAAAHGEDLPLGKTIPAVPMAMFDNLPEVLVDLSKLRDYPVKGKPRTHQARALIEADLKPGHCYFVDPGGGKTFLSIAEAGKLFEMGEITAVLIFAPNGVHIQWIDEQFPEWCDVPFHAGHNQMSKRKLGDFLDRCGAASRLDVLSVNYDVLAKPSGRRLIEAFIAKNPRFLLVVDESHYAKSNTAQRTKETMRWALRACYRRLLSGTPLLRGLEDLWSQYEICQPGLAWPHEPIAMRRDKVHMYGYLGFRTHHCVTWSPPSNPRAVIIKGYRHEDQLRARVAPYVTRIKADEFAVMEKPDIIPVHTPMGDDQAKAYRQMTDHLMTVLGGTAITAQNALVQMGKLLQIASGFLYRDAEGDQDSNEMVGWQPLGSNKYRATNDLIEQLDEPVIIWAPFRALQQQLMIELTDRNDRNLWRPRGVYLYGPGVVDLWKEDPRGILIGNQASGMGVGLNLQHAAANIYMANTFSAAARWQSIRRTDRMGQTRQVRVWDLITPGTLEGDVMDALARKEELSRRNIDGLRELLR